MLDLKKIEAEIDALLASESAESLNEWLLSQNSSNISSYLGTGKFFDITLPDIKISIEDVCSEAGIVLESDNNYPPQEFYSLAA